LSDSTGNITSGAQDLTLTMNTTSGCAWTVSSDVGWITVADRGPGTGPGAFRLAVAANNGDSRTGTVQAASEKFTVHQAGACTYTLKPTYYNAGRGSDTVTINVAAGPDCAWDAGSTVPWIAVVMGSTGSGNGTVRLQVQANDGGERSTIVTVAGQPFTLHQDGSCAYSINPTSYHAKSHSDDVTIEVRSQAGCTWTASSTVDWVTVTDGSSGAGNGKVRLHLQPNNDRSRTTVLTIAGQPFELSQDGKDKGDDQ
jgi:hypothetical protein